MDWAEGPWLHLLLADLSPLGKIYELTEGGGKPRGLLTVKQEAVVV